MKDFQKMLWAAAPVVIGILLVKLFGLEDKTPTLF